MVVRYKKPKAPDLHVCKYCGWDAVIDEGYEAGEIRIECSNVNGCKAWIRIYSIMQRFAVEAWNKANEKG
jgi:hypothetical protein